MKKLNAFFVAIVLTFGFLGGKSTHAIAKGEAALGFITGLGTVATMVNFSRVLNIVYNLRNRMGLFAKAYSLPKTDYHVWQVYEFLYDADNSYKSYIYDQSINTTHTIPSWVINQLTADKTPEIPLRLKTYAHLVQQYDRTSNHRLPKLTEQEINLYTDLHKRIRRLPLLGNNNVIDEVRDDANRLNPACQAGLGFFTATLITGYLWVDCMKRNG